MSKNYLSLHPQNVNKDIWYYEERSGIEIINRNNIQDHVIIPWRKLKRTMARYNKQMQERAKK